MIGNRRQSTRGDRQGFTLVEVFLTLCLLVVIGALVWPIMTKPFAHQRLQKTADRIRAAWSRARVDAMDDGAVYVFRYAIEGNQYLIERRDDLMVTADVALDQGTSPSSVSGAPQSVQRFLPTGVTFVTGEIEPDNRATLLGIDSDTSSTATSSDASWSLPIVFYPDGTTSTAQLIMKNEHDRQVRLSLRGLTGVARVGDVGSDGESQP
ncbi:MAG TPA: hypothetical protein VE890_01570 [Thermoguttaceae bacterium]|nr:hypothetical protein [Thermoguttaceae bacterium]